MTAVSKQLPPPEQAVDDAAAVASRAALQSSPLRPIVRHLGDRRAALCAGLLGFACFLPYPAINVGGTSAVQMGNILTLLMVLPVAPLLLFRRPFHIVPLAIVPLLVSTLAVAATGSDDFLLSVKITVALIVSLMTIWAAQLYAPRYSMALLTGVAVATVLHALVGFWQFYSFRSATFPIPQLYVNQSFLSVQENVNTIARYIQRPFGIFPEPSAMSSSLAPWVLLWAAYFCDIIRFKQQPARWQRLMFAAAAAGALMLMILSRSGHAAITLTALAAIGLIWAFRTKVKPQVQLSVLAVGALALPFVLMLAFDAMADRLGGVSKMGNSSWEDRTSSLVIGFRLFAEGGLGTALFGVGPGISSPALWDLVRLEAVWSILLSYIYETGLLGAIAVVWVGRELMRAWKGAGRDLAFPLIFFVWLVGITITTSYPQLLPLWIALGWLSVWPSVCERVSYAPVATKPAVAAVQVQRPVRFAPRRAALAGRGA